MITPNDISKKTFSVARFRAGYDQDEVDSFLDEIQVDYANALKATDDAQRRLKTALAAQPEPQTAPIPVKVVPQAPPAPQGPSVESVALLLQSAQSTADQIIAKANSDAAGIVASAHVDAQKITADATAKAQAEITNLDATRTSLAAQINDLKATHSDVSMRLQAALASLSPAGGTQ